MANSKLTVCAIFISALLVGCDSDGSDNQKSDTHKLRVIDGYLINADVYVDRNRNKEPDPDEKLDSPTDESGFANIPSSDKEFHIIVKVKAGVTRDSDKPGTVTHNVKLMADGSGEVITPFTTIAVANDKTIENLADELGYKEELLTKDYIALKKEKDPDMADDAAKVHLLARSLIGSGDFNAILGDGKDTTKLDKRIKTISDEIVKKVNNNEDLDKTNIYFSEGETLTVPAPPTLKDFLSNTLISISFNDFWISFDGASEFKFNIDERQVTIIEEGYEDKLFGLVWSPKNPNSFFLTFTPENPKDNEKEEAGVEAETGCGDGTLYTTNLCRSEFQDEFIYIAEDFAITASVDGDLHMYLVIQDSDTMIASLLNGFEEYTWEEKEKDFLLANEYYHLDDLSKIDDMNPWEPKPDKTQITYTDIEETGSITLDGKPYTILRGNGDVYIIKDSEDHPSLLIRSKDLADFIFDKWNSSKPKNPYDDD